jgi:hypothetical protein
LRPARGTPRVRACLAAAFSVAIHACAGPTPQSSFTIRDSAGVAIAVSTSARWDAAPVERWRVGTDPILDLSTTGEGPEHEFFRVSDALRLSDGRIVVANSGSSQVRVYSPEGAHLASIGREGEGPGEFTRFFGIDAIAGDSLLVHTYPSRVTILSPDLEVVRVFDVDRLARRLQAFAGGMLGTVGIPMREDPGENALVRMPERLIRFDLEGAPRDTIFEVPGSETFLFMSELGASGGRPLFGKNTVVATVGDALVIGLADSLSYAVYGGEGDLRRSVRVTGFDLTLSDDEVAAEIQARLGPDPDPFSRDLHEALPVPRTRAAYERLIVDPTGNVWAAGQPSWSERRERLARDWHVFSPEGEWLGRVTMPARFDPFEIGSDHVLGVYSDELDLEHVQLLPLTKPSR